MLAIIQARSDSKRFPKKVLKKVYGNPLIYHVITRVLKSKKISKVIVATSKNKSDDELVKYLKKIKIKFYRGSLANVAEKICYKQPKHKITNILLRDKRRQPIELAQNNQ